MPINIGCVAIGDILVLQNGCHARVIRESGSRLWSPGCGSSVRAIYSHPTDSGYDGDEGDWDADGTKQSAGAWPEGSDVVGVIPGGSAAPSEGADLIAPHRALFIRELAQMAARARAVGCDQADILNAVRG